MFYKNFPEESSEWILPLDIDKIMSSFDLKSPHDWIHLNTKDVLSDKGQMWFLEKGIHLSSICLFFIAYPNDQGPIHIDHKINDAGFNFVLSGSGSMQWLDVGNAEEYPTDLVLQSGASMKFTGFSDVRKLSILDSWQGDRGMVRVGTPHRIVTFKSRRICLSLRQASGASKSFDELITAF
jgi:hypothetical protein